MSSSDLDQRFMKKLRDNGLIDEEMEDLLSAPEGLKVIRQVVTGIQVHSKDVRPYLTKEVNRAGQS